MRGLMIQGTASDVGKSLLLTALCRIFVNDGYRVAPFKSQNMSRNLFTMENGQIISKAQALQAKAAKVEPNVYMNPIILNPQTDATSEVIVLGKTEQFLSGKEYRNQFYEKGIDTITYSLQKLSETFDMIIMEGAGSPVEMNLKDKELVNMKVAKLADVPVILVADIDRGGVFASVLGTLHLLTEEERKRVKGIIINKFRGDLSLFEEGIRFLEEKSNIPILGVVSHIEHRLEREDSLSEKNDGKLNMKEEMSHEEYDDLANKVKSYIDYERIKNIVEQWSRQ